MFEQLAGYTLASNIGTNDAFTVDETLYHRHNMSELSPDIHYQRTLQTEEVSR
jgi:hypothetical protein